jgi:hypothetical protein
MFQTLRVGEGWVVYEAYEVKKRGGKLRCVLLRRIFFLKIFCYEVIVKQKKKTRSTHHFW